MKVAINGLGRIGEQFFLAAIEQKKPWDFIINHSGDLDDIVYTLKYDSIQPSPKVQIKHDSKFLYFGKKKIPCFQQKDPEKLPWAEESVDLVVECTGKFSDRKEASKHLKAGAKKVLISAPAKNPDSTISIGINEKSLKKTDKIISAGSCTTDCIAPMVKILDDAFGVKAAQFVTTHAMTSTQDVIDSRDSKDPRRGIAATISIVPTSSGASQCVSEVIPSLMRKLDGYALRVPVVDGSITSLFATVNKKASIKQINDLFKKESKGRFKKILSFTKECLVSADIIHNPCSCIFDSNFTRVNNGLISIAGWYDNEWGYANRLVEVADLIIKKSKQT
jgi:glyceraldehyde 3-phosphate dehydrogenase